MVKQQVVKQHATVFSHDKGFVSAGTRSRRGFARRERGNDPAQLLEFVDIIIIISLLLF